MGYKKTETPFYNGNSNVKIAGVKHEFTLEEVKNFQKCIKDPIFFINNYVKITSIDKGIILFKTHPYQDRIINTINDNRFTICKLFRQSGKQLGINTRIPTPYGFKKLGDIHIGDQVLGPDGKPTRVLYESEVCERTYYRITFDTGETVECCEDHLWTVHDRLFTRTKVSDPSKKRRYKYVNAKLVLTAKEMLERGFHKMNKRGYYENAYYIYNTEPVDVPSRDLKIDPYSFGLWLGDGNSSGPMIMEHHNQAVFESEKKIFREDYCYIGKHHPNLRTLKFNDESGLTKANLKYYGVLGYKHIPNDYIFCSKQDKIALLQGLMDTDGFVDKKSGTSHLQFSRKYTGMMETVPIFLRSLGLKVTTKDFEKTNSRRFSFMVPKSKFATCRIPHKAERLHETCNNERYINSRTIVNIEKLPEKQRGKCIMVDNEEHMYLCGTNFLPTHNSTVVAAYCLWYATFHPNKEIVILANKEATSKEIFSRVQQMYELLPDFIKPGVKEYNKKSMILENGSKISCQATSGSAVRGKSIALIVCDEFAFLQSNIADEFMASTFPALSSSNTSKLVLISTPYGLNHFYKIWHDSEQGLNSFARMDGKWQESRDEAWYEEQCKLLNNDPIKIAQELECVDENTIVELFDKATNKVLRIPIKKAYEMLSVESS